MKTKTIIALASSITATAFAGSAKETMAPASAPAPSPSLGGWFIGGTYGQLDGVDSGFSDFSGQVVGGSVEFGDFDFDLYSLHIGRDFGTQVLGCDIAAYLEVAYLTGDMTAKATLFDSFGPFTESADFDLDIIPVTLNIKLERNLFGALSVYGTAGAGYAFSDIEFEGDSERDGGFYAQASAGLLYNITQNFEGYAGASWLYLDSVGIGDVGIGDSDVELDNDFAWEVGLRYNF